MQLSQMMFNSVVKENCFKRPQDAITTLSVMFPRLMFLPCPIICTISDLKYSGSTQNIPAFNLRNTCKL